MRYEIGIAGSGGQGVILMGIILTEAVASAEELFVALIHSFDPAVRGGRAASTLVISDEEIDYPGPLGFDLLLGLTQRGLDENIARLKRGSLAVIDAELVNEIVWDKILRIPFTRIARDDIGDERVANMTALGALSELCEYLSPPALRASISSRFKGKALDLNLSAFEEGLKYAADFRGTGIEKVEKEDMEI